jgi:hypothetical protein
LLAGQDLSVQLAQVRRRLDAQLLDEHSTRVLVGLQRFGAPSAPVQGQHQLGVETLAKRVRCGQFL